MKVMISQPMNGRCEEDIKILEEMIENANIENMDMNNCFGGEHIEAIEHILSDYKRVLKENEELKGTLRDTQNSWFEDTKKMEKLKNQNQCYINSIQSIAPVLIQEYIEKQEIKDKIGDLADTANKINDEIVEELKSKDICQEYLEDKRKELGLINRDIKTLQSLLDEREDSKDGEG